MAITGYDGKPGHGKSYEVVVHQIYHALRNRRHVVTNIPLFLENFAKVDPIFEAPPEFVVPECRGKKDSILSDAKLQELIAKYQEPAPEKPKPADIKKVVEAENDAQASSSNEQTDKSQTHSFQGVMSSGWQPPVNMKIPQIGRMGVFKVTTLGADQPPPPKEAAPPPKRSITEVETIFKSFLKSNPEPEGDTWINPWHYVHFIEDAAEVFAFQTRLHYGVFLEFKFGFPLTNEKGEGALYVIDEAQRALPVSQTSPSVENFFQLHRHYGVSIVLITQNFKTVSTKIQVLIEDVVTLSKNHIFGSPKTYLRFHHSGLGGPFINKQVRSYIPKYFLLYKSYTQGGLGEAGKVDFASIWSRPSVIAILIFLFACLSTVFYFIFFSPSLSDVTSGKDRKDQNASATTPSTQSQASQLNSSPLSSQPPKAQTASPPSSSPPPLPPAASVDPLRVGGFSIHQGGFGSLVLVSDSQDKIPPPPKNLATYLLFKKDSSVIQISSADLIRMGYKIKTELKCYSVLEYTKRGKDKNENKTDTIEVTCDIPPMNDAMQTVASQGARPPVR